MVNYLIFNINFYIYILYNSIHYLQTQFYFPAELPTLFYYYSGLLLFGIILNPLYLPGYS